MQDLKTKLQNDLLTYMRAKDSVKTGVIRYLMAAIKNREIELRTTNKELDDAEIIDVIIKDTKKRNDSIDIYKKSNRQDLVDEELEQLEIIKAYLPKQLDLQEIKSIINTELEKLPDENKDFKTLIKVVMPLFKGKADSQVVLGVVKELTS